MNINNNLPHNLSRLLPENLYHITTAKRFAKIKEDKFLDYKAKFIEKYTQNKEKSKEIA